MAQRVVHHQLTIRLYAMEEEMNKGRKSDLIKCHGRPYTAVGGRPWMALGTPKVNYVVTNTGPV